MASSPTGIIIPGLLPPPGVTSNFVDPYNGAKYTVTMVATLLPLATAFVWIRMYTRVCLIRSHGRDDCELSVFYAEETRAIVLISSRYFFHGLGKLSSSTHLLEKQVPTLLLHIS